MNCLQSTASISDRLIGDPGPSEADPADTPLSVALWLDSPVATASAQPVTVGLPFPRGALSWPSPLTLCGDAGLAIPVQGTPLARWSDGSVRWLLLDFVAPPLPAGPTVLRLTAAPPPAAAACVVREQPDAVVIDTGAAVVRVDRAGSVLGQVTVGGRPAFAAGATGLTVTDARSRVWEPRVEQLACEATGPVRATVRLTGTFARPRRLRFDARIDAFAGTGLVRVRLTVHNPRRARHAGGLWDLGDRGSLRFRDLSLTWTLADAADATADWWAESDGPAGAADAGPVEVYQDSSGGAHWDGPNHGNWDGRVPCAFRGYRVRAGGREQFGLRADPVVTVRGRAAAVTAAVPEFWQQFPKAVEAAGGALRVRLFPAQFGDLHELQGGEQKTHTVWLHVGDPAGAADLGWVHRPAVARAAPDQYAAAGTLPHLSPADATSSRLDDYLRAAVNGPASLFVGREAIDEYGWRNYGEVYADHEAAYFDGPKPVVSHYNNQYDLVYGAILQFCRTGDRRWWDVAAPLARHVADIDIYHTTEDKAAYNGGLFWFTDHYKAAATCTHRTYSRANRPADGRPYGGGPGSAHNFSTGLAAYYYLTGDPVVRAAAVSLADWVVGMDDGVRNVLGLIDPGPTGLASYTADPDYHGPGRGPGLSVNTLLDGWALTGRREYLDKAEELIRRVAHPDDDIPARDLLNVELRWSYPIFFVAVDRYLGVKAEAGELDSRYAYGRACLLHYAEWMVDHEIPYFDQRERLEYPTETWAAQEFRKANVLRLAAAHADEPLRGRLLDRGKELADRAWDDLLGFASRHVARAVAIVMVEGTRDDWFRRHALPPAPAPAVAAAFGPPTAFVSQKQRVLARLLSPRGLSGAALRLVRPSVWRRPRAIPRDGGTGR